MTQHICGFCNKPLEFQAKHSGDTVFDLYTCKGCQSPNHDTMCRQLFYKDDKVLLSDFTRIDEFCITRYYQPTNNGAKYNYSIIFKEVLGVLESSPDMEPMTLNKPVCEIDHIIELPLHDIELLKHKLHIWTTFS